jgi:hypothetical protein
VQEEEIVGGIDIPFQIFRGKINHFQPKINRRQIFFVHGHRGNGCPGTKRKKRLHQNCANRIIVLKSFGVRVSFSKLSTSLLTVVLKS